MEVNSSVYLKVLNNAGYLSTLMGTSKFYQYLASHRDEFISENGVPEHPFSINLFKPESLLFKWDWIAKVNSSMVFINHPNSASNLKVTNGDDSKYDGLNIPLPKVGPQTLVRFMLKIVPDSESMNVMKSLDYEYTEKVYPEGYRYVSLTLWGETVYPEFIPGKSPINPYLEDFLNKVGKTLEVTELKPYKFKSVTKSTKSTKSIKSTKDKE
jgi:hypothetical protein